MLGYRTSPTTMTELSVAHKLLAKASKELTAATSRAETRSRLEEVISR